MADISWLVLCLQVKYLLAQPLGLLGVCPQYELPLFFWTLCCISNSGSLPVQGSRSLISCRCERDSYRMRAVFRNDVRATPVLDGINRLHIFQLAHCEQLLPFCFECRYCINRSVHACKI